MCGHWDRCDRHVDPKGQLLRSSREPWGLGAIPAYQQVVQKGAVNRAWLILNK